jgi:hypothetical protein
MKHNTLMTIRTVMIGHWSLGDLALLKKGSDDGPGWET